MATTADRKDQRLHRRRTISRPANPTPSSAKLAGSGTVTSIRKAPLV